MATLNSYELKGNKQSFANWISNLSPTETPFSSMTGKEAVSTTKFFWQTDRLAKAVKTNAVQEGSDAGDASMGATTVLDNVTQILRRGVKVSDTANTLANFGRGRELAYQMEKQSVALKRDLETILLSDQAKAAGSSSAARKTAGYQKLVAAKDAVDADTGAKVHFDTATKDVLALSDIRAMTTELYLADADATVIMFHPKHAAFWASLQTVGSNVKMFDGDSKTFSLFVNTYIDEFGRTYKLVPNRFMPVDALYFFNPRDFTQMVLRAPNKVELGKEGNYEEWMIEMEVGLRLRDPFAAGLLKIKA